MPEQTIHFNDPTEAQSLLGQSGELVQDLASAINLKATARDIWLKLEGPEEEVARGEQFISYLRTAHSRGAALDAPGIRYMLQVFKDGRAEEMKSMHDDRIRVGGTKGKVLFPRTLGQKNYLDAIRRHDLPFGVGPAGTGKTYLAMAVAASELLENRVNRIILTRPAVEAGEQLGFLPGDMFQKVQPYLKPLYDALHDMMDSELIEKFMERGIIEVAPLAFMRGRTLNNSFIILDEAQNTTPEQMMMFLTRMGYDSKVVVTGDPSQIDLPNKRASGLVEVLQVLRNVEGVARCVLTEQDVVRHELVQRIVRAYRESRNPGEATSDTITD